MSKAYFDVVAGFYDNRVFSPDDLNARLADSVGRAAHHHAGLLWQDEPVPNEEEDALAWLYKSEEALSDFTWSIVSALATTRPRSFLDLGCGEAGTAVRFHELAGSDIEVTGITISTKQRDTAQQNCPPGRFILGNMLEVADEEIGGPYNVIYAIESTEYLGGPGLLRLMRRANSWLSPGGLIVIVAGTRAESTTAESHCVWAFDQHYKTSLSSTREYLLMAQASDLSLAAQIDLGPATLPYWQARSEHPSLQNSTNGAIETLVAQVLEDGRGEYHLFAWYGTTDREQEAEAP